MLKIKQKNLSRKGGRLDNRTEQQLFCVESIMSNGNLELIGEKSKEMYPHLVPLSQVKRFLLKKRSCPTSLKYVEMNAKVLKTFIKSTDASGSPSTSKFVTCSTTLTSPKNVEMNAKVPNTATNPSASGSQSTSKFVTPSTTLTSLKNVETNAKVPNTATNSTIAISSPSASGSPSTSKFVTCSTTLTLPTVHHTQTNPVINCKGMKVGDAGFSLCGGLVKTTKSLSAFFKLVYFFSSGGWLAKCLVLTAAQFSLSPACAVTYIGLRGCSDVS